MPLSSSGVFNLIKAALEAGVIKLHGSANSSAEDQARKAADLDAAYLLQLVAKLEEKARG